MAMKKRGKLGKKRLTAKAKLAKRRANVRRVSTGAALNELISRRSIDPSNLHLKTDKKADRAAKSLARAAFKFLKEYRNACDKYSDAISSEPMTRQAVLNVIMRELGS